MNRRITRALVLLCLIPVAAGAEAREPLVAIEIETLENTLDSCMGCGCRSKGVLVASEEGRWWVAFGLVSPDNGGRWLVEERVSHCGVGPFDSGAADYRRTVGTPYVVVDLALAATPAKRGDMSLRMTVGTRQLSGFDEAGGALYESDLQGRMLGLSGGDRITLPVLIPDGREKEAFGVHEVLVRLRATLLGQEVSAGYGVVAVSADVPGAEVHLDGGVVGRALEGKPLVVRNVRTGEREVRVRDVSGREAKRRVMVKRNKTTVVAFGLLDIRAAEAKELVSLGQNSHGHEELWRPRDAAIVVRVPAGEFLRGSPEGEGEPHERPQSRLHLAEFLIDKTEVTWRQYRKYAQATGASLPSPPLWGYPDHYPVSALVWQEAREYCEWVGGRLPTEAEWEKAARGTDGRKYPWGEDWEHDRCNSRDGGPHRPLSVGSFRECLSPYGVMDMTGSVWEWCSDWYREDYYADSPSRDPRGPGSGRKRVLRGGAWISPGLWLRPAFRYAVSPTYRNVHYGVRCVMEAPES